MKPAATHGPGIRSATGSRPGWFLGLGLGDRVPDAKTVWLYRKALAKAGMVDELFAQFDGHLARRGYIARGGQILDVERARATGSSAPARDRNVSTTLRHWGFEFRLGLPPCSSVG